MAYSFSSRVVLPANWQRKNLQPYWYRMKVPQFIQNKFVVCYQSRQNCELQFKGDFTVDAFHKSPFPILDSDAFNPMFGYYPVSIPEHHWFHQWNEYGDLKFFITRDNKRLVCLRRPKTNGSSFASDLFVSGLKSVHLRAQDQECTDDTDDCPICIGPIVNKTRLKNCGHLFCKSCISNCLFETLTILARKIGQK